MKKIGALLIILLLLSGFATWFILLNISYFTSINLFGYLIENVSSGALVLVSFIIGGIIIWLISFIAYSIEIQQLKEQIQKAKIERQPSNREEEHKEGK
ncbi:lipopolysaccharide assembly protein LapA domain-containing protein [Caldisericum exile]|uniref:Lipopolysaccharide assembly protein A domain-containing protein n=1 Tax=Caldisericum exile (strain DSM 21853 / NBRC 104410 / AZM16c01) TaxID=511051 RepID=A0A7U6JET6_CALEA|nr:lipopolysaccharide assembly protein LapA domain-containing protein [Caldisericum exile]BAL81051.1 hypothetical protein CSE_09250 [Caldisericum exile AZM16c01]